MSTINSITEASRTAVLTTIKTKGVQFGNRWVIREEGTGSYEALVFRDLKTSSKKDSRYAMRSRLYKDY